MEDSFYMVNSDIAKSIKFNQTYMPGIKRVTFNTKTEDEVPEKDADGNPVYVPAYGADGRQLVDKFGAAVRRVKKTKVRIQPILTTKVDFSDGTFVVVRNSATDRVSIVKTALSDGTVVETADDASKERAVVYAIVKRMIGHTGAKKNSREVSGNFGAVLSDIVGKAYDQNVRDAEAAAQKRAAKKAYAAGKAATKSSPKRKVYTKGDLIQLLGELLSKEAENAGKQA